MIFDPSSTVNKGLPSRAAAYAIHSCFLPAYRVILESMITMHVVDSKFLARPTVDAHPPPSQINPSFLAKMHVSGPGETAIGNLAHPMPTLTFSDRHCLRAFLKDSGRIRSMLVRQAVVCSSVTLHAI